MYKWHAHSAIGRGRPLTTDFVRAVDGIAASLRQFSISVARAAENDDRQSSRTQRSQEAVDQLSSLAPQPSRGIDARSLAAKPPSLIRRVDEGPTAGNGNGRGRSTFNRGAGGAGMRTGGRLGGAGFRGGKGGRGRGAARGGRARRGGKRTRGMQINQGEVQYDPLTEEEVEYMDHVDGGFEVPYEPSTTLESLRSFTAQPVAASPMGVVDSLVHKMQVGTGNVNKGYQHANDHMENMLGGHPAMSVFESTEQRAIAEAFYNEHRKNMAEKLGKSYAPGPQTTLPQKEKDILSKTWAAGQYDAPKFAESDDVLGQVDMYTKLNETYLPTDKKKLEDKLRSLLPAAYQNSARKPL